MEVRKRIYYLLFSWIFSGLVYMGGGLVTRSANVIPESVIDHLIPFNPEGIWLYLMFYLYIPFTFLFVNAEHIKLLSRAFVICAIISGIIFFVYPTSVIFPEFKDNGISSKLLRFVAMYDTSRNCLPSLHGSLLTLCTLVLLKREKWVSNTFLIAFTLLMFYSILQVRRHVFMDLAAGVCLALLVWFVTMLLMKSTFKSTSC